MNSTPTHPIKTMARLYQKIYEADPLCCPKCGGEIHPVRYLLSNGVKIICFISTDALPGRLYKQVIRQILKHLGLWIPAPSRDHPNTNSSPKNHEPVYEIFDDLYAFNTQADDCPGYDESCIAQN